MNPLAPAPPSLLHQFFERAAQLDPDRVAIDIPPKTGLRPRATVTYGQLSALAANIAAAVRSHVASDMVVAILLPRDGAELYAAQIGTLQAGAAYTCIDSNFPDALAAEILRGAAAVLTDAGGKARLAGLGEALPPVFDVHATGGKAAVAEALVPVASTDLAYVIYTSGTTGKPKGVQIEHRSITNLVGANVGYFRLDPGDRVAQCSSPAYDSSVEETWLALAVGATLVPLDDETVRLGPDLTPWLRREGITVFCPPPTLLRGMGCADPARELPALKLLYVGGEALPADLAERWAGACWMENGYGPTEAAVTALRGRVHGAKGVTIGRPVANCQAYILDPALQPVEAGGTGELCLGGAGLARGYRDLAALTAEKFPTHPIYGRIYRTGDLARVTPEGEFECLGRIDSQVKLRGFRIELEAIEAQLAACAGVRGAACKLQSEGASQLLVAHLVAGPDAPDAAALQRRLRETLPAHMVPARMGLLAELPVTAGGKLDRARLPDVPPPAMTPKLAPRNDREQAVAAAFAHALRHCGDAGRDDDFFLDLGGDSLTAVAVIVALRDQGWNPSVRDLYAARTVAQLARQLKRAAGEASATAAHAGSATGRPVLATSIQCLWLAIELSISGWAAYAAAFLAWPGLDRRFGAGSSAALIVLASMTGLLLYAPASVAVTVALKRVLIGRYRPLRAPAWGGFYIRHWIVTHSARHIPWWLLQGTVLTSAVLRVLGARVGRRVVIHRGVDFGRGGWDLLTLGDDVTLGQEAAVRLTDFERGEVVVGAVTLGAGATLETRAGVDAGTVIGCGGYLTALSWLPAGQSIGDNECWDGVPAVCAGTAPAAPPITVRDALPPSLHAMWVVLGRIAGVLVGWLPWLLGAAFLVSAVQARSFSPRSLALAGAATAAGVVLRLLAQAWVVRRGRRPVPEVVSAWSWSAIRIDAITGAVDEAGRWLAGSLFWPLWLRWAGMRIGPGCEISTIIDVVPAAVTIGAGSFFADGIYLGSPVRHRGVVAVLPTVLGCGTFLGNHAVIPAGHDWPDGLFVGVATVPRAADVRAGSAWFGQPPMELPRREVITADRRLTVAPTPARRLTRLFWELMRMTLSFGPVASAFAWAACLDAVPWRQALLLAPAVTAAVTAGLCLVIVPLKWLLLGRTRPGQRAFWSCWCGRWDFLYVAWEFWGRATLAELDGTLVLNAFLRLVGVRIGRRVLLGPNFTQVVDPDMLDIGDDATLCCHLQTHSFEDRVLKMDVATIGAGASLGEGAIVFFGATVGAGATLAPHSVLMKYDHVPARAYFGAAPARTMTTASSLPHTTPVAVDREWE